MKHIALLGALVCLTAAFSSGQNDTAWVYFENEGKEHKKSIGYYLMDSMYIINETGKVTFCGSYAHQYIWMIIRQNDLLEHAEEDGSMLDGQVISYRDEGQIESILNFKDGEFNGPAMRFYRNGKLEFYMDMKDGMIDGSVFHFDKNGLLMDVFRGEKEWINSHFYIFSDSSSIKTIIDVNPQYPKGNIIYSAPDNSD